MNSRRARPLRDNPRLILAGMILLLAALAGHRLAGEPLRRAVAGLPHRVRALRPLGGRPHDPARPDVRARAQRHQADRRAAPRAAVRALPRQARGGAARHDAGPCGARAARRQRADPEQRRSLVQRAGRRRAHRRGSDCQRLLQRSSGARERTTPSGWRVRSAALAFDGTDAAAVRDHVSPEIAQGRVKMVEVYRVQAGPRGAEVLPYVDVAAPDMPQDRVRSSPIAWRAARCADRSSPRRRNRCRRAAN